jgi:hypothetical protein
MHYANMDLIVDRLSILNLEVILNVFLQLLKSIFENKDSAALVFYSIKAGRLIDGQSNYRSVISKAEQ